MDIVLGVAVIALIAGTVWWAIRSMRHWPQPPPGDDATSQIAEDRLRFRPWSHGSGTGG